MTVGVTKTAKFEDGKLHIIKEQNFDAALKAIRALRDQPKNKGLARGRHVGSIPAVLAHKFMQECGAAIGTPEWNKYAARKLRDSEYEAFRVHG